MIANAPMLSTSTPQVPTTNGASPAGAGVACARRALRLPAAGRALSACVGEAPPGPEPLTLSGEPERSFVMADGARLPYRSWLPAGPVHSVVLALHGFNDSRDAWELPAPSFAAAGIAFYAPDQRGF